MTWLFGDFRAKQGYRTKVARQVNRTSIQSVPGALKNLESHRSPASGETQGSQSPDLEARVAATPRSGFFLRQHSKVGNSPSVCRSEARMQFEVAPASAGTLRAPHQNCTSIKSAHGALIKLEPDCWRAVRLKFYKALPSGAASRAAR